MVFRSWADQSPTVASVAPGPRPGRSPLLIVGTAKCGSGRCRQRLDRSPGADHLLGAGPVGTQVAPALALPAGEPAGQVEDPVAQQLGRRLAQAAGRQGEVAEAGQQVRRQRDDLGPGDVDCPEPRRPPGQAQVLGLLDAVLDVGVGAVAGIQPGDLPAPGVGGDQLEAAAQPLLPLAGPLAVARMQRLAAPHDSQPGDLLLPGAQVQQAGQLGDEGVVYDLAGLVDGGRPRLGWQLLDGVQLDLGARPADRELPAPAARATTGGDVLAQLVRDPGAVQPDQQPPPVAARQPGHRAVEQCDVVGSAVGGGVARPGIEREYVVGVVAASQVRAEPDATLVGRDGVLLLR